MDSTGRVDWIAGLGKRVMPKLVHTGTYSGHIRGTVLIIEYFR